MTVEAVIIYLGIVYAGCAAVSIADSFASSEISSRLQIAHKGHLCSACNGKLWHINIKTLQLLTCSVPAGDAIAINMPMTVEAVIIYLGIIYAGCAAVSIADSFAPSEISSRLQIAHTKAIFVQDVILRGGKAHPLYERVTKANGPTAIVLPAVPGRAVQASPHCHAALFTIRY